MNEGVGVLVAGLLGLLAFVLALTLSFASDRFSERRTGALAEVNAIGTAWLRAKAIGQPRGDEIARLLEQYTALRIDFHRATFPVRSLHAWMEASEADVGAIFRKISRSGRIAFAGLTPGAVRRILLHRAALAGLAVAMSERLSPHGLRAGFITQAHLNGASEEAIMAQARHRDWRTTRRYIRQAKVVTETPAKRLGL